jgi:hypothetical protein
MQKSDYTKLVTKRYVHRSQNIAKIGTNNENGKRE